VKNIQIIDGADNATYSIFQATDEEFATIFPQREQDLEVVEDFVSRVGEDEAKKTLSSLWIRPIHKRDVQGIHGTPFLQLQRKGQVPAEVKARNRSRYGADQRVGTSAVQGIAVNQSG
jgi:hypothetical protein